MNDIATSMAVTINMLKKCIKSNRFIIIQRAMLLGPMQDNKSMSFRQGRQLSRTNEL